MQFLYYVLFAAGVVALDQWTKYLTVTYIPLQGDVPFIPGVLQFSHIQNSGAAFSSMEGQRELFVVIFAVFTLAILLEYFKKPLPFTKLERWSLAAIYAGGLGNMIDRLRWGYVVDMIETVFIDFPVFNVADCFITCGCVVLFTHMLFFNKELWKDDKKKKKKDGTAT